MGGLGGSMPFVRSVFAVGALALAGLPFGNGFWSKELILEGGLEAVPWTFVVMVIGAGLTALYTFRMVWLVFFGQRRVAYPVHDAPAAMRIALGILAVGTLTTWLLAGPFGDLLRTTLPFHQLHVESTLELIGAVLAAPATWVALAVIALGLATWWWRSRLVVLSSRLQFVARAAAADFGFEWLNRRVVIVAQSTAIRLRRTQTGQLNWNMVGIVGALVVVLVVLVIGR
jgi:NADH-quinone oxidoreductase subunit L